jgi:hypothetical protein
MGEDKHDRGLSSGMKLLRTAFGLRVEDVLGLLALPAALAVASATGARFSFWGVLDPLVTEVYQRGFALFWVISPIALVWCKVKGRLADPTTDPLTLRNAMRLLRGLVSFCAVIIVYSNLKAMRPLAIPWIVDDTLASADRVFSLFAGSPNQMILALDAPWFVWVMDWAYMIYFPMFIMYLGVVVYYAVPSLGTLFLHPEWYQHLAGTKVHDVGGMLLRDQLALMDNPGSFVIGPFAGIGAFPSLHVAQSTVFLAVAGRWMKPALIVLVPLYAALLVATVYWGMHYVWDLPAGVLLAWGALRIEQWVSGPLIDSPHDW